MDYNARYYSARLGRFVSPDTIIPNPAASQTFNRFAYAYNNPVRYNDPSGHCPSCAPAAPLLAFGPPGWVAYAGLALVTTVAVIVVAENAPAIRDGVVDAGSALADSIPINGPSVDPLPGYGEGELNRPNPGGYHPGLPLDGEFTGPLQLPGPSLEIQAPTTTPVFSLDLGIELPNILEASAKDKPPSGQRPRNWRKGTRPTVENRNLENSGGVLTCEICGRPIEGGMDLDHFPTPWKYRPQEQFNSRKDELDWYNDTDNLRCSHPSCNRRGGAWDQP